MSNVQELFENVLRPAVSARGQILLSQLNDLLPVEMDPDELDQVFLLLDEEGIEVVDDKNAPPAPAAPSPEVLVEDEEAAPEPPSPEQVEQEEVTLRSNLRWYKNEIAKIPRLTPEEEMTMAQRAREGDPKAIETMVSANLRLVVSLAKNYAKSGVNVMDLIQVGNEGLMEAARRFDPNRGARFASFATWWIRQPIVKHIAANWSSMRVPTKIAKEWRRLAAVKHALHDRFGRSPTTQEVADEMKVPRDHIEFLDSLGVSPLSLDAQAEGKEGLTLEDVIPDENTLAPDMETVRKQVQDRIEAALKQLTETEETVLRLRFGLFDGGNKPLEEVARLTGMGRDEVRQIEQRALNRLRQISGGNTFFPPAAEEDEDE